MDPKQPTLYEVTYYWTDPFTGGCVTQRDTVSAYTAEDAVFQTQLAKKSWNDRYFAVTDVRPSSH